ncbi:MAG: hypothetical protein V4508_00635 [Pseudomonadota bacterium]
MQLSTLALGMSLCGALAACGGGNNEAYSSGLVIVNDSGQTAADPNVAPVGTAGIYAVNFQQFQGIYTFLENGQFSGIHYTNTSVLLGHPRGQLSAANSQATPEPIAWANFVDDLLEFGQQDKAAKFGRTFSPGALDVSIWGNLVGHLSAQAVRQKAWYLGSTRTLYNDPIPLATLSGKYKGIVRTVGILSTQQDVSDFVLDGSGAFSVSSSGCHYTGKLVQHGATGVFDVSASISGCALRPEMKGLVTPMSYENDRPQLGIQLDSADELHTAVFVITKI